MSQYLRHNESIGVDKASSHFLEFSAKQNINYVLKLFSDNGSIEKWHEFKRENNLHENSYFQWMQLIDCIPKRFKFIIKENYENATSFIIHDHHSIQSSRVITLDKLASTEIYSILISEVQNKPSSNIYFENLLNDYNIDCTTIYMLLRLVTYNTYIQSFPHKILNNVLVFNKNFILFE